MIKKLIDNVDLYISSTCNLRCSYCYISQNKAYYDLNKSVVDFINDNKFIDVLKKVFPNREDLKKVNLWGGEPTLNLNKMYQTIDSIINEFPNMNEIFISTNFTTDISILNNFIDFLSSFDREIKFSIQISLDGPHYINDYNRNSGTTAKIEHNLFSLATFLNNRDINDLKIFISFKSTISASDLNNMINSIDTLEFYHFYFEKLFEAFFNRCNNANVKMTNSVLPSIVSPGKYTTEDGKNIINYVKLCYELDERIGRGESGLKYHKTVNVFRKEIERSNESYLKNQIPGYCGVFKNKIAILPNGNGVISGCHRAFPDYFLKYSMDLDKNNDLDKRNVMTTNNGTRDAINNNFIVSMDEFLSSNFDDKINRIYGSNALGINSIASQIYTMSLIGQVDKIYSESNDKLRRAAYIIRTHIPCIYDNVATTGSFQLRDMSKIRLFCNGLIEYILEGEK